MTEHQINNISTLIFCSLHLLVLRSSTFAGTNYTNLANPDKALSGWIHSPLIILISLYPEEVEEVAGEG